MCVTVGRSDMSKFTFTINNERAVRTLKASSEGKNCFERIPLRPEFAGKFLIAADVLPGVFCNLADSSSVKTNQENMPTAKKTTHRSGHFGEKQRN